MNRMSSLPIARYCPVAPRLSEKYGSGRAALMGSAFHAACANGEEFKRLAYQLTEDEMAEIMQWRKPEPVDLGEAGTLRYEEATIEATVALNSQGGVCGEEDPDAVTVGHVDCYWIVETAFQRVAYVLDMKKSEWTVETRPEEHDQLQAYGLAVAQLHDCDAYCVGIWACIEAVYDWSETISLQSNEARDAWERVLHAATNEGEARRGGHCRNCYGRFHCPEYLLPAAIALEAEAFAEMAEDSAGELDNDKALKLLMISQAAEDVLKVIKDNLKEYARRAGGIRDESSGKRYALIEMKGRKSLNQSALRKDHPKLVEQYTKEGAPYTRTGWVNL